MSENNNEQTELLREMTKWLRFLGMKEVKTVLRDTLNDNKKIIAYYHSDGKNTSRIVSQISDMSQTTISDLWKEWLSLGLGDTVSASGGNRFKKSFDLKMFGFTVSEVKVTKSQDSETIKEDVSNEQ
ncbi:MAG: hypothetical protein WD717_06560 [Nitrosarchaeum sp.]